MNESKHPRKGLKKPAFMITVISFTLALSVVCYGLADRYLIEHVQTTAIASESATGSIASSSASANAAAVASSNPGTATTQSTSEDVTTLANAADDTSSISPGTNAAIQAAYDDWSYTSDSVQISITKVETGSGSGKVTYYVADVQVADGVNINTAFAKDLVGQNITQDTSVIAENNDAILAINGDYYGFRDDGILIRNGVVYRDLGTRDGLALNEDGTLSTYDETTTDAAALQASGVTDTFSFGPILVHDGTALSDFGKVTVDTNMGNRSIQNANPRTGIGMISANHYVFIVVDGRSEGYSRGVTLEEFAGIFEDLGCTEAYNLDGGGSSTMTFMGRVVNNPLGKGNERGVSDILYIAE